MRRVATVGALAALAAGGIAVAVVRWPSASVEARPFPAAAAQLAQLWRTAPRAPYPLPPSVRYGGGTTDDTYLALDRRLASGRRLQLYVERRPAGHVCVADNIGTSACFDSFADAGGNIGSLHARGANLLTGVLRDGTTSADVEIFGQWRHLRVEGRMAFLDFGSRDLGTAVTRVRYHLFDGSTKTCEWLSGCT